MTRLAALNARITGDSSGFVKAAVEAETAAQRAENAIGPSTGGATGGGGFSGASGRAQKALNGLTQSRAMRLLPMQFSQVAQQAAAGTPVLRALTIQAADIGLAFGVVGTIIGTLATVAMPVLIGAFQGASDEAENTEDALDGFSRALDRVNRAADIAKTPIEELRAEYGRFAEAVQATSRIVAQSALAEGMREFREVAAGFAEPIANVEAAMRDYERAVDNLNTTQRSLGERTLMNADAFDRAERSVDEARATVVAIAADMGMTVDEVALLSSSLDRLSEASGPDEVAEVASSILAAFEAIYTTTENIPPQLAALIVELRNIQTEAAAAAVAIEDIGSNTGQTGDNSFGVNRGNPNALTGMSGSDLLPPAEGEKPGGKTRPGGARATDTFERDLETMRDQLATELEVEQEMHAMRNEMLAEALERELLTHQEYNDYIERERERHQDAMSNIDVYKHGTALDMTERFMGDMASAMATGNEKMMQIAKVFGAGEALINAWRTYSQVMADPSLPWFAKIPAAVSLLGSAMQAVTAIQGVGKGGSGQRSAGGAGGAGAGGLSAAGGSGPGNRSISLTLIGESGFSRAQIVQIAEALNDSGDEGQELVQIRGRR